MYEYVSSLKGTFDISNNEMVLIIGGLYTFNSCSLSQNLNLETYTFPSAGDFDKHHRILSYS